MKIALAVAVFLAVVLATLAAAAPLNLDARNAKKVREVRAYPGRGRKVNTVNPTKPRVLTPPPKFEDFKDVMPRNFSWDNVKSTIDGGAEYNIMTGIINQHIGCKTYCGSCWACGTTSALSDRISMRRVGKWPMFHVAPQVIINYVPDGCDGGDPMDSYGYMAENGIPDSTCQQYLAEGLGKKNKSDPMYFCRNCAPAPTGCYPVPDDEYSKFGVAEFGQVLGEQNMMAEIFARGPISCGVDAGPIWNWGFDPANRGDIFTNGKGKTQIDHEISVYGFGEENGVKYWLIRNSWGVFWSNNGYFRLERGQNQLGIEGSPCSWAVPIIPARDRDPKYSGNWWM